ncbi:hypothetical protein FGB62_6g246 [Gracilaria domingensis]|nr:hypothetical protein FGB62_6g246 [Gracilaria domingensis]
MSTSAAFTTTPPLSPARQRRREQILQLANRRGWLIAPRAAHIVEACHSAWRAGTLPEVSLIPSPSSCEDTDTSSDSDAASVYSISSNSSQASSGSDQIDMICDTLKHMDVQGDKHGSKRGSLKSKFGNSQARPFSVRLEQDGILETTQKELEGVREDERRDPSATRQLQMKSLSTTSTRNLQFRRPDKTRTTTAPSQYLVASSTSPPYFSDQSLTPPTHHDVPHMTQDKQQQLSNTTPLSTVQTKQFAPKAIPADPISHAINGQQHTLISVEAYATTAPPHPTVRRSKAITGRAVASRRAIGNLDHGSEHEGLKHSHEWLQPGPFFKARDESARMLMRMFDRIMFNNTFTTGSVPKVTLEWNCRLMKTAGQTKMKKHSLTGERRAVVVLSTKVIDEPARLYKTLAHELCHAAAWIIDNTPKPPHGEVFKAWGERFRKWDNNLKITRCHDYTIHYKYNYTCVKCGKVYGRHSKSIDTSKKVCGVCKGALQLSVVP